MHVCALDVYVCIYMCVSVCEFVRMCALPCQAFDIATHLGNYIDVIVLTSYARVLVYNRD